MYQYAENNPINFIDPSGLSWERISRWFNKQKKKVIETIDLMFINEKEHYERNKINNDIVNEYSIDTILNNWEKAPEDQDLYHENGSPYNDKYWGPITSEGQPEVVINSVTNQIVIDARDMGTLNKGTSVIGHIWFDMVPYYIWGNTPDDPTPLENRLFGPYEKRMPNNDMLLGGY